MQRESSAGTTQGLLSTVASAQSDACSEPTSARSFQTGECAAMPAVKRPAPRVDT